MDILGAFLFYVGLFTTMIAIIKLTLNYISKIGLGVSKKLDKNNEVENENLVNNWIKSNIKSIAYRMIIMIIGLIILLIYAPKLLPW